MLADIIDGLDKTLNNGYDLVTPIISQIKTLIPIVLPAVIGFVAFRKGWKFLRSSLRSA